MSALHLLTGLAIIVLYLCELYDCSGISSNNYKKSTDVAPTGTAYNSVSTRSRLECSKSCSKDPKCSTFTIKEIGSVVECEFYECWEDAHNTTTPGVNTYTKEVRDSCPCPSGLPLRHESHCYVYHGAWMTLVNARAYCTSVHPGAYLVEVDTAEENSFVLDLVDNNPWLGGRRLSGTWTWTHSGRGVYAGYENWYTIEPSGTGDCMYMVSSSGTWFDWSCISTRHVVCEYGN